MVKWTFTLRSLPSSVDYQIGPLICATASPLCLSLYFVESDLYLVHLGKKKKKSFKFYPWPVWPTGRMSERASYHLGFFFSLEDFHNHFLIRLLDWQDIIWISAWQTNCFGKPLLLMENCMDQDQLFLVIIYFWAFSGSNLIDIDCWALAPSCMLT